MTAADATFDAGMPISLGGLVEFVRALFSGPSDAANDAVVSAPVLEPRLQAFVDRVHVLARGVFDASNGHELRQRVGDVAFSEAFVSLELECAAGIDVATLRERLAARRDHRDHPNSVARTRLCADAVALVVRAVEVWSETIAWEPPPGSGVAAPSFRLPVPLPPASVIARARRQLVLGDVIGAEAATVVLANFRGPVALLALMCAVLGLERLPDWKSIALGELAVAGMEAFQRLVLPTPRAIDIAAEERHYQALKADVVARLLRDDDAS